MKYTMISLVIIVVMGLIYLQQNGESTKGASNYAKMMRGQ